MTSEQVNQTLDTIRKLTIEAHMAVLQGEDDIASFCQIKIGFWRTLVSPYLN